MNPVHLHLLLNHLPVIGLPIGLGLAAFGALRRQAAVERAGLCLLILFALSAPAAYLTGEPAEEALDHVAGVSGPHVEEHEGAAQWALAAALLTGCAAVAALWFGRGSRSMPAAVRGAVWLLGLVAVAAMVRTANLGGMVHHPELRGGAVTAGSDADD